MQTWKSANIFVFLRRWYAEDFTLKHLLTLSAPTPQNGQTADELFECVW